MKKLISILLSLMLIMTSLPMIASADGEQQEVSFEVTDTMYVNTTDNKVVDKVDQGGDYTLEHSGGQVGYVVYRFNLPMGAIGVEIESATLSYWTNNDWIATDSFFPVPYGTWTSKADVTPDYIASVKAANYSENYVGSVEHNYSAGRQNGELAVDVTKAVQDAVAAGNSKFALSFNWSTNWYGLRLIYNEGAAEGRRPTLTVKYRTTSVPEMLLKSVSVNKGDTIDINDSITFTYSNAVDASKVSAANFAVTNFAGEAVSISDSDISVSGTTVTISKTWDSYGAYEVAVLNIADQAQQTLASAGSVSFKTGADSSAIQTVDVSAKDTQAWNTSNGKYMCQASEGNDYIFPKNGNDFQSGYMVYRFELPSIGAGKAVSSATLSYWHNYDWIGTDLWFTVPFGDWTEPSATWNDEYVAAVEEAASRYEYIGSYGYNLMAGRVNDNGTVDVLSAIKAAVASGENKIALSFHGGDNNTKTYTRVLYNEGSPTYAPKLIISYASPEFASVSSTPEKGAKGADMSATVEMALATTLDDAYVTSDYIQLINTTTGSAVNADVAFDSETNILTVDPDADLEPRNLYKVVLKAGIQDAYGNTLSTDKAITAFTTGGALECFPVKFTAETTPIYDSCITLSDYTASSSVTAVAKITNGTSKDYSAVMIIALYDEYNKLIAIDAAGGLAAVAASDTTQLSKSITVPADKTKTTIKAFVWDGFDYIRPLLAHGEIMQAQ